MNDKWEFYKDVGDKWRWRRTAPNGNIVGASTEGYANKNDCEGNARRNGWNGDDITQTGENAMTQKEQNDENREIKSKAYELYRQHGFKDGNDFIDWLEAEKQSGKRSRSKYYNQMKNILFFIVGMLSVIIVIILLLLFRKEAPVVISEKSMSDLKIMLVVLDPKVDEKVAVFGDTHFGFDESTLSDEAKVLLDTDVQSLKEDSTIHVRMAGYTSAKGSEEVNQKLSEARANAVRDYLIEKGISPERITVIGYGRTKPALYEVTPGDENTKEALANMRVLFEVVVK